MFQTQMWGKHNLVVFQILVIHSAHVTLKYSVEKSERRW